jgi:CubicO group peptidase (beta-lactamase class C family)
MKLQILSAYLYVIFLSISAQAQEDAKVNTDFDKYLPELMEEYNVPAIGIGIIEDGKISYLKVYGELKKGIQAPKDAIFNVGSISKPIFALFTLKLVEAGMWDLDEPLYHYWVDPDIADDPYLEILTTGHVLSHQTGFPNWRIKNPSNRLGFDFKPGTKFQYSGEGFLYLQRALENKFKIPMTEMMDSMLFKPFNMKNSGLTWDKDKDKPRYAEWHDSQGTLYNPSTPEFRPANVAGSVVSSIEDLCILGTNIINKTGLSQELYTEMTKKQVIIEEHNAEGLGWGITYGLPNGEYAVNHSGWDAGVKTIMVLLPETKRGIIILSNGDNGIIVYHKIISESLDVGEAFLTYIFGTSNHERIKLNQEELIKYTGDYTTSYGGYLSISQIENGLKVMGDGMPTLKIYPEASHTFYPKEFEYQFEFINSDSINVIIGGKIENIAKKISK